MLILEKATAKPFAEFVSLCRQMKLFSETIVAIDGSKFKAVNNRDRNFTTAKMERQLGVVEKKIAGYLAEYLKRSAAVVRKRT